MIGVQQDFNDRVNEIKAYFDFIEKVDSGQIILANRAPRVPVFTNSEQTDLIRTFKASAFLLLYNLMESTVTNSIEAIFDEFENKAISFDACKLQVRRVVLRNLSQHNVNDISLNLNRLAHDAVTKTFLKKKIVSGNVDASKIRDVADEYGFTRPAADGDKLLTVKTKRNDLAHGGKSFGEVGRDYSVPDMIIIKDKVIIYLSAMLSSVATYLAQQHYLSGPDRP
ncbi:MAE_28990/MAE_18760 family HEPN-like nuclease [Herminiimonas fonticola]|uniref:MAE-28990/MAE-18760-like HEPN domain-containing protein n=1 Tax=Herminiimonas fonticola TaxID=303380 RepID=A0A4R6GHW6_9BURK|nr:MAE_28990/MAE_18760 family HEPN-like nuclease [Herminiimonas fonticola]RBA25429.1 hypothetical protein Hfont_1062 [Herminiimonas fonticola]TDN94542.1 hypothetical protein EV677_1090 [Herminiimonas fonticola]